jgi:hypothetical protein
MLPSLRRSQPYPPPPPLPPRQVDPVTLNMYVAEFAGPTIRTLSLSGYVGTLAGVTGTASTVNGACLLSSFVAPASLAVSTTGSILYVGDQSANTVRAVVLR